MEKLTKRKENYNLFAKNNRENCSERLRGIHREYCRQT